MKLLSNLTIKQKILTIPLLSVLGFLVYLLFNYVTAEQNHQSLERITTSYMPAVESTDQLREMLDNIKESHKQAVLAFDKALLGNSREIMNQAEQSFGDLQRLDSGDAREIEHIRQQYQAYFDHGEKTTRGIIDESLEFEQMQSMGKAGDDLKGRVEAAIASLRDKKLNDIQKVIDEERKNSQAAIMAGIVLVIVIVALTGLLAMLVAGMISRSVGDVVSSLRIMSEGSGDLTKRLTGSSRDEIGQLVATFNMFVEKLHGMISNIRSDTDELEKISEDMLGHAEGTRTSIIQQKKETDQIAAAINQLNTSSHAVSQSAAYTSEATHSADAETSVGKQLVTETVEVIHVLVREVEEASSVIHKVDEEAGRISGILDAIRGIAEQTNLLALNAAIEAARAGEQGRGFSVVADEVRHLANRTQDATKEIASMIEQLQNGAQDAVSVMNKNVNRAQETEVMAMKAGESLDEISSMVSRISQMSCEIASAAEEQDTVTGEVNKNIQNIQEYSEATDKRSNAMSISSEELDKRVASLKHLVGRFRL